jgi:hypothetical protein
MKMALGCLEDMNNMDDLVATTEEKYNEGQNTNLGALLDPQTKRRIKRR